MCVCLNHSVKSDPETPWIPLSLEFSRQVLEWIAIPFSRIFPTEELNLGVPYCRKILYGLSHQGLGTIFTVFIMILTGLSPASVV